MERKQREREPERDREGRKGRCSDCESDGVLIPCQKKKKKTKTQNPFSCFAFSPPFHDDEVLSQAERLAFDLRPIVSLRDVSTLLLSPSPAFPPLSPSFCLLWIGVEIESEVYETIYSSPSFPSSYPVLRSTKPLLLSLMTTMMKKMKKKKTTTTTKMKRRAFWISSSRP